MGGCGAGCPERLRELLWKWGWKFGGCWWDFVALPGHKAPASDPSEPGIPIEIPAWLVYTNSFVALLVAMVATHRFEGTSWFRLWWDAFPKLVYGAAILAWRNIIAIILVVWVVLLALVWL